MQKDIVHSAAGTVAAEMLTQPICALKTNYQVAQVSASTLRGVARDMYARAGWRGFYAGCAPAVAGQVLATTSKYSLYRCFQRLASGSGSYPSVTTNVAAGVAAGIGGSLLTHPFEVAKILRQRQVPLREEFARSGARLLYRAYSKSLAKTCVGSALFLPMYDAFRAHVSSAALAGMWTAVIATTAMHPLDYLRVRQVSGLPVFVGWNPALYFRGLSVHLMRVVPHFAVTMAVIDLLRAVPDS